MSLIPKTRLLPVLAGAALLVCGADLAHAAGAHPSEAHAPGTQGAAVVAPGTVTAYTYRLWRVSDAAQFHQRLTNLPPDRTFLVSYWLGADLTTPSDGIGCQIENNTVHGTPDIREVALSVSRQASLVTSAASGVVSTHNRSVVLGCYTDSGNATIQLMPSGAVTLVPVGRAVQRTASLMP
ncbi:MAG: hypothetical protein WAV00_20010 [Nocardioides sp.]